MGKMSGTRVDMPGRSVSMVGWRMVGNEPRLEGRVQRIACP
jgi:hypothetical protein